MNNKIWTVVRFPVGSWSGGGKPTDPDYENCEVYLVPATDLNSAKKKAQGIRSRLMKKGAELPTADTPYQH